MALNNVPLAGQSLNATRVPINQNFGFIGASFIVDHVDYNVANTGKHNKITFPGPVADPVLAAGEIAIYSKLSGAVNQLFIRKGAAAPYAWTETNNATWTRLPSGILIKWGSTGTPAGLSPAINFPAPNFAQCYQVIVSTQTAVNADSNRFVRLINFNALSFTVWSSERTTLTPAAANLTYIAIGI